MRSIHVNKYEMEQQIPECTNSGQPTLGRLIIKGVLIKCQTGNGHLALGGGTFEG
jgi:hypothetical protein